jgi:hypothetical protein
LRAIDAPTTGREDRHSGSGSAFRIIGVAVVVVVVVCTPAAAVSAFKVEEGVSAVEWQLSKGDNTSARVALEL